LLYVTMIIYKVAWWFSMQTCTCGLWWSYNLELI